MKICAVIAEYNPFHNGHFYHLQQAKKQSGCDKLLCIMSGNFTQRGEIAALDKYTRARHAVLGGADIVIELPTVFSTANAEIFAKGAVQILKEIPAITTLSFGAETGTREDFFAAASALNNETKEFKSLLKEELKSGKSLVRAKVDIIKQMRPSGVNLDLLDNPNSILGLEYARAILHYNAKIDILPVERLGSGYNEQNIAKNFSSASAIRTAMQSGKMRKVKKNVPSFVFKDLKKMLPDIDSLIYYSLLVATAEELAKITDCTEGLENRIKALIKDNSSLEALLEKIVTKRYTRARMRRIFLSSFLKISDEMVKKSQSSDLYLKVLAVGSDSIDVLSVIKDRNKYPLITRKNDYKNLSGFMVDCFEKDILCNDIYNFISGQRTNEYIMPIVKKN